MLSTSERAMQTSGSLTSPQLPSRPASSPSRFPPSLDLVNRPKRDWVLAMYLWVTYGEGFEKNDKQWPQGCEPLVALSYPHLNFPPAPTHPPPSRGVEISFFDPFYRICYFWIKNTRVPAPSSTLTPERYVSYCLTWTHSSCLGLWSLQNQHWQSLADKLLFALARCTGVV